MNSPAAAIAWEIWRKNRYGFLLLLIFLMVCVGLSQIARHYAAEVEQLTSESAHATTTMSREGTRHEAPGRGATRPDTAGPTEASPDSLRGDGRPLPVPSPDQRKPLPTSPSGSLMGYGVPPLLPTPPELGEAELQANYWAESATGWSGVLLSLSLLVSLAAFAFTESTPLRGFSGVPSRLFTLPVRTGQLIAVPMALGTGFVALLYFTWSRLMLAPLLPADMQMPDGYFLLLLPATLAWFQTLVWILPGFPRTRATLLILLITTVAVLSGLPFGELNRWPERKAALMAVYAASLVMAPLVAWIGVRKVRQGEWRDWPALTALMNRLADTRSRRREFSSPGSALFWIECRRNGRFALWGLGVVILFILGLNTFVLVSDGKDSALVFSVCGPILMFMNFIWTPVLGLMVCGDVVSRRLPLTAFQATRPVAVGQLVAAKLKALIAIWAGGWLLAALSVGVWAVVCGQMDAWVNEINRESVAWVALMVSAAFSLHVLVGLFPLWLTGRVPGLPWSFVGLLILYGGLSNLIGWFGHHPDYSPFALLLIGFAAAMKLGLAFAGFRQALKRRWIKRGFVFSSVAVWVLGTALFVELMSRLAPLGNWNEIVMLAFAVLVFPLSRIALAPLAMAMNRHR
jgi:hypothetical protein